MARIKINNIPEDLKISKEEMRKVFGGATNEDLTIARTPHDVNDLYLIDPASWRKKGRPGNWEGIAYPDDTNLNTGR